MKIGDCIDGWGRIVQIHSDYVIVQYPTWTKKLLRAEAIKKWQEGLEGK